MSLLFIYDDNYVGKQTSSKAVRMLYTFAFYFAKKLNRVKIDPCCADVCAFLSMLMRVKAKLAMCKL